MGVLSDHGHFALGHKVLGGLVNFADWGIKLLYLFNVNTCCRCHSSIFRLICSFFWLIFVFAWVKGKGNGFAVYFIFNIAKHKSVLSRHCCWEPENTLLVLSSAVNYLEVWVHNKEVNHSVFFLGSGLGIYEIGSSDENFFKGGVFEDWLCRNKVKDCYLQFLVWRIALR